MLRVENALMDGIININKPAGMTSFDVIAVLRKILNTKKIGHTGTLDPDATGVLPICVGRATKLAELLTADDKAYIAGVRLGVVTDTQDLSGEVLEENEVCVSEGELKDALKGFTGEISQIPPMYSAVRINGERLYKLAREGKTVERPPRTVFISELTLLSYDETNSVFNMEVHCSKGTYIRTLANDIGAALGCGGAMCSLERIRSGRFLIDSSFTLDEVRAMTENGDFSFMTPLSEAMSEFDKITLAESNARKLIYGMPFNPYGVENGKKYRLYDEKNTFLAIGEKTPDRMNILKTFFET